MTKYMELIIVESPTKAKTLKRFLGSDYVIEASMGHIRDLPESRLGINLNKDFEPEYVVSDKKKDTVALLSKVAKKADNIILATDPDREGEAISWHIAELLPNKKFQRITFHEITQTAIKEALNHPGKLDMNLVDAQQARRILDRLVGYKLSPLLWRKVRRGLSAGRVQSVAVRLIVEREREIKAFKPVEYWEIIAQLQETSPLEAKLVKTEIKNKEEADKIIDSLKTSEFKVTDVVKKEVRRNPYPPFTTSTLQQAASNLFGWSAKKTMQSAQKLYEEGLITYHRTDSTNLATEAVTTVREFIGKNYGPQYVPDQPRLFKTKSKVAQEAHEAIRPTNVQYAINNEQFDKDKVRLYELIWKRFVACQMNEAIYEQTSVDIEVKPRHPGTSEASDRIYPSKKILSGSALQNDETSLQHDTYLFKANGNKQIFDGWQHVNEQSAMGNEQSILPELEINQILKLLELVPSQHFTEPPARYNEASLIKTLEEFGIGRPSTYAPIISTILERNYVEKTDKRLYSTVLGDAVTDFLMANFPIIMDYKFTAGMEDSLDEVANGNKKWIPLIAEFYKPFEETLEKVGENAARVKIETEEVDEKCPQDGSPLVIRLGKFGKFLACSKFPGCKFTKPLTVKIDIKCSKCGGDVILRKTRNKKIFYGCSNYPKCDFASWNKPV